MPRVGMFTTELAVVGGDLAAFWGVIARDLMDMGSACRWLPRAR